MTILSCNKIGIRNEVSGKYAVHYSYKYKTLDSTGTNIIYKQKETEYTLYIEKKENSDNQIRLGSINGFRNCDNHASIYCPRIDFLGNLFMDNDPDVQFEGFIRNKKIYWKVNTTYGQFSNNTYIFKGIKID